MGAEGGWQPPRGLCMQMLERGGRKLQTYRPHQLGKTPGRGGEAWHPQPQGHSWERSPTASLWRI